MTIISDTTGRWELVTPDRRIIAWRHPFNFDDTGRWHFVVADRTIEPYRDDDTMQLVDDLIDSVIICRSGSTADAGAQLSVIASLIAELDARLPEAIFDARDQDLHLERDRVPARHARVQHPTPLQRLRHPPKGDAQQLRLRLTPQQSRHAATHGPARHQPKPIHSRKELPLTAQIRTWTEIAAQVGTSPAAANAATAADDSRSPTHRRAPRRPSNTPVSDQRLAGEPCQTPAELGTFPRPSSYLCPENCLKAST